MKKVGFGNTGLRIAPLVFGSLPLGPLQADLSPEEGGRLIRQAVEGGVNLIDTAELYETYGHIRAGLDGFDGQVLIATKTHSTDPAVARTHVERALRELGRERLDIVHMHAARVADPFAERQAVLEALVRMKQEGKIAHVGLSSHYVSAIAKAAQVPEIEVLHPLINRTGMGIIDGTAQQMEEAIALAAGNGKGIYAMKALAGGNLISDARRSLEFVMNLPGVQAVAVGMLCSEEVSGNLALFSGMGDEGTDWARLQSRTRKLRIMDRFCKGCGLCVAACTNDALHMEDAKPVLEREKCILCGYCGAACPEFIIRVV